MSHFHLHNFPKRFLKITANTLGKYWYHHSMISQLTDHANLSLIFPIFFVPAPPRNIWSVTNRSNESIEQPKLPQQFSHYQLSPYPRPDELPCLGMLTMNYCWNFSYDFFMLWKLRGFPCGLLRDYGCQPPYSWGRRLACNHHVRVLGVDFWKRFMEIDERKEEGTSPRYFAPPISARLQLEASFVFVPRSGPSF